MQKTCSVCGCLISDVYYTLDSGKVVCERDYRRTLDPCRKCGQPVEGKLVKLSGSSYHPQCFRCQVDPLNVSTGTTYSFLLDV